MRKIYFFIALIFAFLLGLIIANAQTISSKDVAENMLISMEKTYIDIDGGYKIFRYYCPFDACYIGSDISAKFTGNGLNGYKYYIQSFKQIDNPIIEDILMPKTCLELDNKTGKNIEIDCSYYQKKITGTKKTNVTYWEKITPDTIVGYGVYPIKISLIWNTDTAPKNIDWMPVLTLKSGKYPTLNSDYTYEKTAWDWFNATWNYCTNITITEPGFGNRTNWVNPNGYNLTNLTFNTGHADEIRIVNASCNENGTSITYDIISNTSNSAIVLFPASVNQGEIVTYSVYHDAQTYYSPEFTDLTNYFDFGSTDTIQWYCGNSGYCNTTLLETSGVISEYYRPDLSQYTTIASSATGMFGIDQPTINSPFNDGQTGVTCVNVADGNLYISFKCTRSATQWQNFTWYAYNPNILAVQHMEDSTTKGWSARFAMASGSNAYYSSYNVTERQFGSWNGALSNISYFVQYINTTPNYAMLMSWDDSQLEEMVGSSKTAFTGLAALYGIVHSTLTASGATAFITANNESDIWAGIIDVTDGQEANQGLLWHYMLWYPYNYQVGDVVENGGLPPEPPTSTGNDTNVTFLVNLDTCCSDFGGSVTQSTCLDSETLATLRNVRYCTGKEGNYTPTCYWLNTTKLTYCTNGCYENITENGASCSPTNFNLWILIGFFSIIGIIVLGYSSKRGRKW